MKNIHIKLAILSFLLSWSFALIETAYFLIVYGWHWRPYNRAEEICDFIAACLHVTGMVLIALYLLNWATNHQAKHNS